MRTVHNIAQGSDAWRQFRLEHFGASEAAAMLGLSPHVKRSELLHAKSTGIAREFDEWVQTHVLDHGHAVEKKARPLVEDVIKDELYPITCSQGRISASCDGLTLNNELAFEHKQWSVALAAAVKAGEVPPEHMPQCQQVLMVTQARRLIFVVSDGTIDNMVWVYVDPNPEWFARLRAGWAQFVSDLATYVPAEPTVTHVGRAPSTLPALHIEVQGQVTASNLASFKRTALAVLADIKTDLKTDEDFADAATTVKWCGDVETRLAAAKEHALSQTSSIDTLFKALTDISAEVRRVRLNLQSSVESEKLARRTEIVTKAQAELDAHIASLNQRFSAPWVPLRKGPFADAIKGKKSIDSCRDAAATALANAKIETSALADRLDANRKALVIDGSDWFFLFADFANVGNAPAETFGAVAAQRIQQHQAAEAARKQREDDAQAELERQTASKRESEERIAEQAAPPAAPTALAAVRTPPAAVGLDELPEMKLGELCALLGFTMTAAFVTETLRVAPKPTEGRAVVFTGRDVLRIGAALATHVDARLAELHAKVAA